MQETQAVWVPSLWVRKILCRRKWQPTTVLLPGESHGQRSLGGYSPWGHKESDTTEWLTLSLSLPRLSVFLVTWQHLINKTDGAEKGTHCLIHPRSCTLHSTPRTAHFLELIRKSTINNALASLLKFLLGQQAWALLNFTLEKLTNSWFYFKGQSDRENTSFISKKFILKLASHTL